ncbi:MAG: TlpA family protein disulfide reductase, partial [SAR202 cluster bacterium]|nr:TlpA family protein disulfide reductase [SAR202 cluster bacterium]
MCRGPSSASVCGCPARWRAASTTRRCARRWSARTTSPPSPRKSPTRPVSGSAAPTRRASAPATRCRRTWARATSRRNGPRCSPSARRSCSTPCQTTTVGGETETPPGAVYPHDTHHFTTGQHRMRILPALTVLAIISLVLLAACGGDAAAATGTEGETKPAPAFELALFGNENHTAGEALTLAHLDGRAVVINFWYPSCPPCREEMPDFEAAFRKYKDRGVEFVGVQSLGLNTAKEGQEFVDEYGITYAVGPDATGDVLLDYKVIGFPSTIFLDREHNIVRHW